MKEQLKYLIQEYSIGKLTIEEQIELSSQLADPQNKEAEGILFNDWNLQLESNSLSNRDLKPTLDKIHHHIHLNETNKVIRLNWWQIFQRIAAILIFPLVLSFLAYFYFQDNLSSAIAFAQIECPLGVRTKFLLPDGTTGYLNSGSRLKYPVQFIGERNVELSGEAFFDVIHHADIPFNVNTKNLNIKVLGTTFNVIAYEGEQIEEIVLQTGEVNISSRSGNQLAALSYNQRMTLNIEKRTFTKEKVLASQYTSWKDGKLVFRNENMQQVARRLSRWYNAEVVVDDRMLEDYTFHATFMEEPLDEVLKLLSLTTPLSYKEDKRESDTEGVFRKRKIILKSNKFKFNEFK